MSGVKQSDAPSRGAGVNSLIVWHFSPELPDDEVRVLIATTDGEVDVGHHENGDWITPESAAAGRAIENVFAWAHLPEAPESVTENVGPMKLRDVPIGLAELSDANAALEDFERAMGSHARELAHWFVIERTPAAKALETVFALKPTKRFLDLFTALQAYGRAGDRIKRTTTPARVTKKLPLGHGRKVSATRRPRKQGGKRGVPECSPLGRALLREPRSSPGILKLGGQP